MSATTTRQRLAEEYVEVYHMCDWVLNERRQEMAQAIGLTNHWQSHAAYLEARAVAGMQSVRQGAT